MGVHADGRLPWRMRRTGYCGNEVNAFLKEEGVAISITPGYNGDGGTIFATYGGSENPKDPIPPPIVAIAAEQYNRLVRPGAARYHAEAELRYRCRLSEGRPERV